MTTAQIIFFIMSFTLFVVTSVISANKIRKEWYMILWFANFMAYLMIMFALIISLITFNKQAKQPKPPQYQQVTVPSDTLYRKI